MMHMAKATIRTIVTLTSKEAYAGSTAEMWMPNTALTGTSHWHWQWLVQTPTKQFGSCLQFGHLQVKQIETHKAKMALKNSRTQS